MAEAMVLRDDESIESEEHMNGGALVPVSSLDAITRGEVSQQIATAKKYPRMLSSVLDEALTLATMNEDVAKSCYYRLKRKNKDGGETIIEGPSVRLAEIIASAWGNIRFGARIIDINETHVVAQGYCADLQKNVAISVEVQRGITTRNGKRYGQDMITVTAQAAQSIALRNAILRVVPRAYADGIMKRAKEVAVGDAATLDKKRVKVVEALKSKFGLTEERIFSAVGARRIEDVDLDKLSDLIGYGTAIKDGQTTVDQAFPLIAPPPAPGAQPEPRAAADVAAHVANVAAAAQAAAQPAASEPEDDREKSDAERAVELDKKLGKADLSLAQLAKIDKAIADLGDEDLRGALQQKAKARREAWGK